VQMYEYPEARWSEYSASWIAWVITLGLGGLLTVISFFQQFFEPAPYGRAVADNAPTPKKWGPPIPARVAHMFADGVGGFACYTLTFFLFAKAYPLDPTQSLSSNLNESISAPNVIAYVMWAAHYVHRGFITPFFMRFSSKSVPLFVDFGTFLANAVISYSVASFVGAATYPPDYHTDPRFIIGIILFVIGYAINKWADIHLRNLRKPGETSGYVIPTGFLYNYIVCPNYFGETVEWTGFLLLTWTWGSLVWLGFCLSTFIPRAVYNKRWYLEKFPEYPKDRKMMIPFIF